MNRLASRFFYTKFYSSLAVDSSLNSSNPTLKALSLLKDQPSYHVTLEIKSRPYYVHLNEIINTTRLNDLNIGDVISFDKVREIGSKDFVLQGQDYIDPKYFTVKGVVIGHSQSDEITKYRVGRKVAKKTVKGRVFYTSIMIQSIEIHPNASL